MRSLYVRRLLLLSGTVLAATCSAPTRPAGYLYSAFALRTVDGQPLPALTRQSSTIRTYVDADTIRLVSTGEYYERQVLRDESSGPSSVTSYSFTDSGQYVFNRDSLQLRPYCPPDALCVAPPVASLASDGFLITAYRSATGQLTLVKRYQQISGPPD